MRAEMAFIESSMVPYGRIDVPDTIESIKKEVMLFSCDGRYAWLHGGEITRKFIDKVNEIWGGSKLIVDTRYHMLMPDWYPCIPGWHVDDAPRNRPNNQPNHIDPGPRPEHMCLVVDAGTGSLTEYALGHTVMPDVTDGSRNTYEVWNTIMNAEHRYALRRYTVRSRELVALNMFTLHRGMPATGTGWRMFLRASRYSERPITNEIRKQTQVYMSALNAGW